MPRPPTSTLLNRQGKEAEAAQGRVKARSGFEKLSPDQSHTVLRSIAEAVFDTTADAIAPSLADMQAQFPQRLSHGEEGANERLDQLLSSLEEAQVVKLDAGLRGREIKSRDELRRVLQGSRSGSAPSWTRAPASASFDGMRRCPR